MKPILDNIKLGEQALILDIMYYTPWGGKNRILPIEGYKDDCLMILYKDKKQNKHLKVIPKPEQEIWFTKPEHKHLWRYTRDSVERELLTPKMVRPNNILKTIYEELKDEKEDYSQYLKGLYEKSFTIGDSRMRKELHKYPHVFMSDFSIEDSYRLNLGLQYELTHRPVIKKSFMDIETDILGLSSEDTRRFNMDKINALSFVLDYNPEDPDDDTIQVYGIFVRDYDRYPTQSYWESHQNDFIKDCDNLFNDRVLTINSGEIVHNQKYRTHIMIVNNEKELLQLYFNLINKYNPDTNAIWNIEFDIPKIVARAQENGMDPLDLISNPIFNKGIRYLDVAIDNRPGVSFATNNTNITGTTGYLFIDLMLLYAGMTKGSPSPSHALDFVLDRELGIGKVKFDKGIDISNIAHKDFWKFALYSLNDTVLMQILDHYLAHIDLMVLNTQIAACSPLQTVRPTKEMRQYYSFNKMKRWDLIPGNNDNADYISGITDELYEMINHHKETEDGENDEIDEDELSQARKKLIKNAKELAARLEDSINATHDLGGGMVLSPNNLNYVGEPYLGRRYKHFFRWAIDMDYKSEYPTVKYTRNLGKETELGRLVISKKISDEQDMFKNTVYLPGAEYISDYIAKDWLSMGRAYFNLPSVNDIIKKYGRGGK